MEVVEHRLPEEARMCPQCGEPMREIGTEVRKTLKLIPAKAILRRDVYYTYACKNCKKNDILTPIIKAPKDLRDSRQFHLGGGHCPGVQRSGADLERRSKGAG